MSPPTPSVAWQYLPPPSLSSPRLVVAPQGIYFITLKAKMHLYVLDALMHFKLGYKILGIKRKSNGLRDLEMPGES